MNGADSGELTVFEQFYYEEPPLLFKLWNKKSHDKDEWRFAQIVIIFFDKTFKYFLFKNFFLF